MTTLETKPTALPHRLALLARPVGRTGFAVLTGVLLAMGLIALQGYAPMPTMFAGLRYALGDAVAVSRTLAWGLPLLVTALGVAFAFRAGMFNIGAEGQLYVGAMAAAIVGAYIGPLFAGLHLLLCLAAAALTGGAVAAGLGWLRAHWGVDEVLSTLLSNYLLVLLCTYLANGPLRDPTRQSGSTREVHDSAMFPVIVDQTQLTAGLYVVAALVLATWWLSERSIAGYRWRMTGSSPGFAAAMGIDIARARVTSMAVSGALCGLGGSLLVNCSQGRFWTEIGTGIGWDAVLLALVGRSRPIGVLAWAGVYCVLRASARGVEQVTGIPSELSSVLIAVIIVAAVARSGAIGLITDWARRWRAVREKQQ
ncbi:ABC transporter permease [Streptomyces sp. NPDC059455]|uniref:ABC transporter permease n=1 Tax=Streptomyces sp. NPDC059455 TaxID=3346837 RepID=UPI0036CD97EC